ncbi:hypothetical protein RHCRD62_50374 [Rhodococcus sp. RD6.2]|nr:hypothetical protein RHCRD62_50374 [Rhodococcus sp. RD6.2]
MAAGHGRFRGVLTSRHPIGKTHGYLGISDAGGNERIESTAWYLFDSIRFELRQVEASGHVVHRCRVRVPRGVGARPRRTPARPPDLAR